MPQFVHEITDLADSSEACVLFVVLVLISDSVVLLCSLDDHSRVILHDYGTQYDYVNASYISVISVY